MSKAPIIGISRLRMGTDGHGVTTLVAFHGCPLRCSYCLNPECNYTTGVKEKLSSEELYLRVKKDELYFRATKGGLTFGGGEPLLYSDFIREVLELGASQWHTTIETSLNVQHEKLKILLPYIDHYIVDIKDMNKVIYKKYTGSDNSNVLYNLSWLAKHGKCNDVTIRIPNIPGYNTPEDVEKSVAKLKRMGFHNFDVFTYYRYKKNAIANWIEEKKQKYKIKKYTGLVAS